MHESRAISCVVWKDEKHVLLISTHMEPVQAPCISPTLVASVPLRNGAIRESIHTSPMHLEYTTRMPGVDELRASYLCQTRSKKWWHQIWFFLLDTTVVNMYILYLGHFRQFQHVRKPMTHLQFKCELCEAFLCNWRGRHDDGGV